MSAVADETTPGGDGQSAATEDLDVAKLPGLDRALRQIAAHADRLDAEPAFPTEAFRALAGTGALGCTLPDRRGKRIVFAEELGLLQAVARADGSVGRILDGHLNAVERLTLTCPGVLDHGDLEAIIAGQLLLGVWGADPARGEGRPVELRATGGIMVLSGVKTYCSGAGGVQQALVVARDHAHERRLVLVDLARGVQVDRSWYRAAGLRASESHRVVFDNASVRAVLGGPGELLREPWFSRDAIRTSATWAGIAHSVVDAALRVVRARPNPSEMMALAVGRMLVALGTIRHWLRDAAACADDNRSLGAVAIEARWAIAGAAREIASEAALACGSHPLATGGALSRGRRDLDLFLLQHRLDTLLARHGARVLGQGTRDE